jgi:hypothetical protein
MNNNSNITTDNAQDAKKVEVRQLVCEILIWVFWIVGAIVVIGCLAFLWYYFSNTTNGSDYCKKYDLKKELKTKISNGADLTVVEYVFAERNKNSQNDRIWNYHLEKDYYDNNTTLLQVLEDLKSDFFDDNPYKEQPMYATRDTAYYSRLNRIINEYTQKTPFDGLEEGQRALFIKLQKALGDNYEAVEGKIAPIVNELRSKNTLVDKYLNNSEDSYKLSKVALYATIFFGIFGVLGLVVSIRAGKERRALK